MISVNISRKFINMVNLWPKNWADQAKTGSHRGTGAPATNYSPARRAWRRHKSWRSLAQFFSLFFGVKSWAAANGWYRWHQLVQAHLNTAFKGGICQQNMSFNMYTAISKLQQSPTWKDSHAKCFILTNSTAKRSPGAMNRGEIWERVSNACFCHLPLCFHLKFYTSIKLILY